MDEMIEMLTKGGWIMLPLIICSLVSVAVIIERFIYLRCVGAYSEVETFLELVSSGSKTAEAQALVIDSKRPIVKILGAGFANRVNAAKAMEAVAINEITTMKQGLPILDTIITLSPLLGLLGTIIGMMGSFQIMATTGMGQPHAVTGGVAEALIATATGISVAVITLIPYNYFLARIEKETESIEHYATRLEMILSTSTHRSEKHEDSKKYA
jgi:biopolymer transport protein ExbB